MVPIFEPFKILGIDPNASDEEVKRAYRAKALKYHPDSGGDVWVFQQVQAAYEAIVRQRAKTASKESATPEESSQTAEKPSRPDSVPSSSRSETASRSVPEMPESSVQSTESRPTRLWRFITGKRPLQDETTLFILVNVLDIFTTYALLRAGGIETNPVANFFLSRWNIRGLVYFKMTLVAVVALLAQVIAHRNLARARQVLILGTVIVAMVVLYSVYLILTKIAFLSSEFGF